MHQIGISAMHAGMIVKKDCYPDEYEVLDKAPKHAIGGVCLKHIERDIEIEIDGDPGSYGTWIYVRKNA